MNIPSSSWTQDGVASYLRTSRHSRSSSTTVYVGSRLHGSSLSTISCNDSASWCPDERDIPRDIYPSYSLRLVKQSHRSRSGMQCATVDGDCHLSNHSRWHHDIERSQEFLCPNDIRPALACIGSLAAGLKAGAISIGDPIIFRFSPHWPMAMAARSSIRSFRPSKQTSCISEDLDNLCRGKANLTRKPIISWYIKGNNLPGYWNPSSLTQNRNAELCPHPLDWRS